MNHFFLDSVHTTEEYSSRLLRARGLDGNATRHTALAQSHCPAPGRGLGRFGGRYPGWSVGSTRPPRLPGLCCPSALPLEDVFVGSGHRDKTPQTWGLKEPTWIAHGSGSRARCWPCRLPVRPPCRLVAEPLSVSPLGAGGVSGEERQSVLCDVSSRRDTSPGRSAPHPRAPFKLSYPVKALSTDSHIRVGVQHMNGGAHSVHSR